jgi:hypothetical protein
LESLKCWESLVVKVEGVSTVRVVRVVFNVKRNTIVEITSYTSTEVAYKVIVSEIEVTVISCISSRVSIRVTLSDCECIISNIS